MLELELPYPPSVNRYWRHTRRGTFISPNGVLFRSRVVAILRRQEVESQPGRLMVGVQVFPPDNRRRDLDNVLKALLDALKHGGAYEDDSQIDWLLVQRGPVCKGGKTVVQIRDAETGR